MGLRQVNKIIYHYLGVPIIVSISNGINQTLPPTEKMCIKDMNWTEWSSDIENTVESNHQSLSTIEDPRSYHATANLIGQKRCQNSRKSSALPGKITLRGIQIEIKNYLYKLRLNLMRKGNELAKNL